MGIRYSVPFDAVAITAIQDLWEINAGTNQSIILISITLGETSDAGDAEDEQGRIRIYTGFTTSGSGGSAPTPTPLGSVGTAGAAAEVNNTTAATTSGVLKHVEPFNWRAGLVYKPVPEERIELKGGGRLVVNLPAAPADSLTCSGTLVFEEIG